MPDKNHEIQSVAQVHQQLRNAIITGEFEAGQVTSQVALAEELGVGRTPLREALRHLQTEGLVADEPNRRVRVSELTWEDAEELCIVRILLETAAVRLTVPQLDSSDIAEMRGYLAQMDHYGGDRDWGGLREPHKAFHAKFTYGAGPRISGIISQAFDHAERYRLAHVPSSPEEWAERQAEHRELVAAAIEHDAELTAQTLSQHYIRSLDGVLEAMDAGREPKKLRTITELAPVDAGN